MDFDFAFRDTQKLHDNQRLNLGSTSPRRYFVSRVPRYDRTEFAKDSRIASQWSAEMKE